MDVRPVAVHGDGHAPTAAQRVSRFVAAGALVIFSLADLVLTRQLLARGASELNPIADLFVQTPAAWALKGAVVVVIAFLAAQVMRSEWLVRAFYAVVAIYAAVVVINGTQLAFLLASGQGCLSATPRRRRVLCSPPRACNITAGRTSLTTATASTPIPITRCWCARPAPSPFTFPTVT